MPPTDDLPSRILAAIGETERIAQEATRGPWEVDKHGRVVSSSLDREVRYAGGGTSIDRVYVVAADDGGGCGEEDGRHIAYNDPTAVLHRCQADRQMLTLHRDKQVPYGQTGRSCTSCGSIYGHVADIVKLPCPTIIALAEGYGITVDSAT